MENKEVRRILKLRKAQTAIEFFIIFGAVLFFFTLFFIVIQEQLYEKNREKERLICQEIASSVQDEIAFAIESSDGYSREFKIYEKINGKPYNIEIRDDMINIRTERISLALPVYHVEGQIQKGTNIIRKQEGVVYLNS